MSAWQRAGLPPLLTVLPVLRRGQFSVNTVLGMPSLCMFLCNFLSAAIEGMTVFCLLTSGTTRASVTRPGSGRAFCLHVLCFYRQRTLVVDYSNAGNEGRPWEEARFHRVQALEKTCCCSCWRQWKVCDKQLFQRDTLRRCISNTLSGRL